MLCSPLLMPPFVRALLVLSAISPAPAGSFLRFLALEVLGPRGFCALVTACRAAPAISKARALRNFLEE